MQEFFLKMLDIFSKKLHSLANPPDETKSKKNPAANTAGHKTLFSIILMFASQSKRAKRAHILTH